MKRNHEKQFDEFLLERGVVNPTDEELYSLEKLFYHKHSKKRAQAVLVVFLAVLIVLTIAVTVF